MVPKRFNQKKFCRRDYGSGFSSLAVHASNEKGNHVFLFAAARVRITSRDLVDGWVKYNMDVEVIYKRAGGSRIKRGANALWLTQKSILCKCPKIRIGKTYLLLGRTSPSVEIASLGKADNSDGTRPGIVVNGRTVLLEWSEDTMDKATRFAQRDRKGHCPARRRY